MQTMAKVDHLALRGDKKTDIAKGLMSVPIGNKQANTFVGSFVFSCG